MHDPREVGTFSEDPKLFTEAYMDTPITRQRGVTPEDAATKPGNCVKSILRQHTDGSGFPKFHGILVKYDKVKNEVLVRGHGEGIEPKYTWKGTIPEYESAWECD